MVRQFCELSAGRRSIIQTALHHVGLNPPRLLAHLRAATSTIADLGRSCEIRPEHLTEAIQYQSLDRRIG